jgi:hypothetical protein
MKGEFPLLWQQTIRMTQAKEAKVESFAITPRIEAPNVVMKVGNHEPTC